MVVEVNNNCSGLDEQKGIQNVEGFV